MTAKPSRSHQLYLAIKGHVCSGDLLPGHRVDLPGLADACSASKSPVRNVLNRLVGEGLLEAHPNDGFYRPLVTEQIVREEYAWHQTLMMMALDQLTHETHGSIELPPLDLPAEDPVAGIEQCGLAVVRLVDNHQAVRAMRMSNDRLRALRRRKTAGLFDLRTEVKNFAEAWQRHDIDALRTIIHTHHQRRLDLAANIVSLAYRTRDGLTPGDGWPVR